MGIDISIYMKLRNLVGGLSGLFRTRVPPNEVQNVSTERERSPITDPQHRKLFAKLLKENRLKDRNPEFLAVI